MHRTQRWDIFCRVVDNYGDVGVSWRLARQLRAEHAVDVRLIVDRLAPLARIAPDVDADLADQSVRGVRIVPWSSFDGEERAVADVVIEAFGCGLPPSYLAAMARSAVDPGEPVGSITETTQRMTQPSWINLEYLSAESWTECSHGLPSPHPRLPLERRFYFPGVTSASGGLLREAGLLARRQRFQADREARRALLRSLGAQHARESLLISLFCYANPQLPGLLDAWAEGEVPITCLVPDGVAAAELDRWLGGDIPRVGHALRRGRLTLVRVPFVAQDDFDRLLWSCDVNFVRGEDSFVRGLWAARAWVWQLYPQAEQAQLPKLDAMLSHFHSGLPVSVANAHRAFERAWNGADTDQASCGSLWPALMDAHTQLTERTRGWSAALAEQADLASGLIQSARDQRITR